MCKIMTWQTFKKNYNPDLWCVQDGTKGWVRTTIQPTMRKLNFLHCGHDDIQLDERKPKQIVLEDFKDELKDAEMVVYFVYYPTASYTGYFVSLDIYYRPNQES